jgi:neutral trehalase
VKAHERPDALYNLTLYGVTRDLRKSLKDRKHLEKKHRFAVQDVTVNAILVWNNTVIRALAKRSGVKLSEELRRKMAQTEKAFNKVLWDVHTGWYCSRDVRTGKFLRSGEESIEILLALYSGVVPPERAKRILAELRMGGKFDLSLSEAVPSVSLRSNSYNETRYWLGPVWPMIHKVLLCGLKRVAECPDNDEATRAMAVRLAHNVREEVANLVEKKGFHEFYNAKTGKGLGNRNFSATAGIYLDIVNDLKRKQY